MKDNQANSINDLLNIIKFFKPYEKQKQLFFRGQLTQYPYMNPTIARDDGKELKFEYQYYAKNENEEKTPLQNLAYMQHMGIHTRLLDFTTDPLVSLFFAVNNNQRADSSIYVFIRNSVSANSIEAKLMSYVAKCHTRYIPEIVHKFNDEYQESITVDKAIKIFSHDLFITPNTLKDISNNRMKEQKGTFAFPGNIIKNLYIVGIKPFEDEKSYQEIVIPFEFHEEIFDQLKEKNYSSQRLYGDSRLDQQVSDLTESYNKYISENFIKVQSGYLKGKEYVTTNCLLKKKEIDQLGLEIAKKRNLEMLTIWFQRKFKKDGVNIVTQFWSQGKGKLLWNSGKVVGNFIKNENWDDSFYINRLFYDHPDKFKERKLLPVAVDALKVKMKINYLGNKLKITTNLYEGAKLYIHGNGFKSTILVKKNQVTYEVPLPMDIKLINGEVILLTPSLQNEAFLEKAGIDFEKLTGDFIKRSPNLDSLIYGSKEFNFGRFDSGISS